MKLATYQLGDRVSYGEVRDDGITDFGTSLAFPTLRDAIAGGTFANGKTRSAPATLKLSEVKLLPPIPNPEKILCVGKNYRGHSAAELGGKQSEYPNVFLRLSNTLVPHDGTVIKSKLAEKFDFEGELAVIIGEGGRNIPREEALKHVFGYSIVNEGSVREYQFDHSLISGKNFFQSGGFGPWIVTSDEIPDPHKLTLKTRINGEELQNSPTSYMIWDIPFLISYISTWQTLSPGDVISTGTPGGVGLQQTPNRWLKNGDVIEVEVSGVGMLRNTVRDE